MVTEDREHRLRVLIIDDEPSIRRLVSIVLEDEGYAPLAVASAPEGLAHIASSPPDLVLLDLMMPEMDGEEALRCLRLLPGGSEIPVVIMSAAVTLAHSIAGVQGVLDKPFDLAELLVAVERATNPGREAGQHGLMRGR
jgi:CheY-like chemotaxis protein